MTSLRLFLLGSALLLLLPLAQACEGGVGQERFPDEIGDQLHPTMDFLDIHELRLSANGTSFRIDMVLGDLALDQQRALYMVNFITAQQNHIFLCFVGDPNPAQEDGLRCTISRGSRQGSLLVGDAPRENYANEDAVTIDEGSATVTWEVALEDLKEPCPLQISSVFASTTLEAGLRDPNGGFIADFTLGESDRMVVRQSMEFPRPVDNATDQEGPVPFDEGKKRTPGASLVFILALIAALVIGRRNQQ